MKILAFGFTFIAMIGVAMTIEEKVGQLLLVHFYGEEANDDAKLLIEEAHVGGFIYYNWANGLHSREQIAHLSASLQALSPTPLLIAADQEGGVVCRLNRGFTIFPGNRALSATKEPLFSEEAAYAMGKEMLSVGINFNLSPVIDVNCNPRNPVIGIRSFGEDPEIVTEFAAKALAAFHRANIVSCLKHYPGHGDVEIDSHEGLPTVLKSQKELEKIELLPFARLASKADAVMTAHILVPALDPRRCSTLSEPTLCVLRKMGFEGVIVSDSLLMRGVLDQVSSVEEAAIEAFNAGCDLLILGGKLLVGTRHEEFTVAQMQSVHRALVRAVNEGRITGERLDASVGRILALKKKCAASIEANSFEENALLAKRIAEKAIQVQMQKPFPFNKAKCFAPKLLQDALAQTSISAYIFDQMSEEQLQRHISEAEALLCFSCNAWKMPEQRLKIEMLSQSGKPFALVVTRDPLDAELFSSADLILTTYSPTSISLQAACDQLMTLSGP